MLYFLLYLITALCSIARKYSKFLFGILTCLLFIMTVFSQNGNDIENIRDLYLYNVINADMLERSSLFTTIVLYFSNIGVSFTQFRIMQFIIWFIPIFFFLKRFSLYPTLVLACCFFFPMCGFGAQFRNGLMVGFIYLALYCLFSLEKKKGIIAFCLIIAGASFFHTLALIYYSLLLIFVPIDRKVFSKYCIIGCVVMAVVINTSMLFGFVSRNFGDWDARYFEDVGSMTRAMFILVTGLIANIYFSSRFGIMIERHPYLYSENQLTMAKYIPSINYLMLVLMPLLFLSMSFYRIFQNIYILTAILSINTYRIKRKSRNNELAVFLLVYAFITFYYIRWQGEFLTFLAGIRI